jgi:hypothetical protein
MYQFGDMLRKYKVNVHKIDESSSRASTDTFCFDYKVVNGEVLISFHSFFVESFCNFKISGQDPYDWEKNGKLFNYWHKNIEGTGTSVVWSHKNKIYTPSRISNEYRACICRTAANFQKSIRRFPQLDL